MTIQEAATKVLEAGPATNHELERIVPTMVNCCATTVMREVRKLDYTATPVIKDGKQTRTWTYRLNVIDSQACFA